MSKPVLFDLDGTLADFDGAMDAGMRSLASPEELAGGRAVYYPPEQGEPAHITRRRRAVKARPGFWRDLGPLALGSALLGAARELGAQVLILSRVPRHQPAAWAEKVEWCHRHLDGRFDEVLLVTDKDQVDGLFLVDDFPPYVESWLAAHPSREVFVPSQPWNLSWSSPRSTRVSWENLDLVVGVMARILGHSR